MPSELQSRGTGLLGDGSAGREGSTAVSADQAVSVAERSVDLLCLGSSHAWGPCTPFCPRSFARPVRRTRATTEPMAAPRTAASGSMTLGRATYRRSSASLELRDIWRDVTGVSILNREPAVHVPSISACLSIAQVCHSPPKDACTDCVAALGLQSPHDSYLKL